MLQYEGTRLLVRNNGTTEAKKLPVVQGKKAPVAGSVESTTLFFQKGTALLSTAEWRTQGAWRGRRLLLVADGRHEGDGLSESSFNI